MNFQLMFYGGIAGAILSLILSIIIFIKWNISEAFEDLTGFSIHKWAKKLQQRRRARQEQFNKPITREIQPRRDVELEAVVTGGNADSTELLTEAADATELLAEVAADETGAAASTEPLIDAVADETELLSGDAAETELLSVELDETELLNEGAEETTVLSEPVSASYFIKERDVVIVHTDATI